MKITELKIKRKSLAEEARMIRAEERKGGDGRESLYLHRTGKVRSASRYSHLAHAFLIGRPYRTVERHTRPGNDPSFSALAKEVRAFRPDWQGADENALQIQSREIERWLAVPLDKQKAA